MPVIPGTFCYTIKSWSYELVVTEDGNIICESCAKENGIDPESEEVSPIFADQEWSYYPQCVVCEKISYIVTVLDPKEPN